jgi:peptide/nickel transport system permease protein
MLSGTLLIWFFSITLAWLPATGQIGFQSLILPALAVGLSTSGAIARAVDAAVSDVMDFPFILAARARGLPRNKIIWQHALPVALAPILDIVSVQFGYLLAGTIVAETVFARQGLGRLLLVAVLNKDLPLVQGVVAVNAFFYIVFSIIADVLRGSVDPRIRFE